jgi:hypothetical protein
VERRREESVGGNENWASLRGVLASLVAAPTRLRGGRELVKWDGVRVRVKDAARTAEGRTAASLFSANVGSTNAASWMRGL